MGIYNFMIVLAFQLDLPWAVGFILLVAQAAAVMIPVIAGFCRHASCGQCRLLESLGGWLRRRP